MHSKWSNWLPDQGFSFCVSKNKNLEFKWWILLFSQQNLDLKHSSNAKMSPKEEENKWFKDWDVQSVQLMETSRNHFPLKGEYINWGNLGVTF